MSKSSEKTKAAGLQGIIDYIESDEIDAADSYGNLLEVADMAEKALATSKETDLERLRGWLDEVDAAQEYGKLDYMLAGLEEAEADDRISLVMIVIDEVKKHIADQIGGEAEDAE